MLFILATVASLTATALVPTLTSTGYLTGVADHSSKMATALLLNLIGAGCSVGIAITLYPVLRELYPALALGSVIFRTIEAVVYTAGVVSLLSLLSIGQHAPTASATDRTAEQAISRSRIANAPRSWPLRLADFGSRGSRGSRRRLRRRT